MASSGTVLGSFSSGTSYQPYIKWSIQSQDVNANTSTIYIEFGHYKASSNSTSYNNTGGATLKITSNGVDLKNGSVTFDFRSASVGTYNKIWSGTQTVTHNTNGTKTVSIRAIHDTDTSLGTCDFTANAVLNTIPRASTVSSLTNLTLANSTSTASVTIGLTVNSTSFKHKIEYKIGSTVIKTETNKTFSSTGSQNYTFNFDSTQVNNIFSTMSTKTSETATIVVTTYASDGTTVIGTSSKTATITLNSTVAPSISSVSVSETVSEVTTKIGSAWVQNKSIPKYTITASASRGSSISEYKVVVDGLTLTSTSNQITLSRPISSSGNVTATITVKDARGITTSTTTTITVLAYNQPSISTFEVNRCLSDGTTNETSGTYAKTSFTINVADLTVNSVQKNSITYKLSYKEKTSGTWLVSNINTTENNIKTKTITDSIIKDTSNVNINVSITKAYDFKLEVSDVFGSSVTLYEDISTAQVVLSINKAGVGIGKVWQNGTLDISGTVNIEGDVNIRGNSPNIHFEDKDNSTSYQLGFNGESFYILKNNASGQYTTPYILDINNAGTVCRYYGNEIWHNGNVSKSLAQTGYIKFTNGLTIQWGKTLVSRSASGIVGVTVTFPIQFSTNFAVATATCLSGYPNSNSVSIAGTIKASQMQIYHYRTDSTETDVFWIAIGY